MTSSRRTTGFSSRPWSAPGQRAPSTAAPSKAASLTPEVAARNALDLLARGGSLIVLPDSYGAVDSPILGRDISVAEGPVWLAERSHRPLVPFLLIPPGPRQPHWRLWCDEPIEPTQAAVVAMLERSIRRQPTAWAYWRGWFAAPLASPRPALTTA